MSERASSSLPADGTSVDGMHRIAPVLPLRDENDLIRARRLARRLAEGLGLSAQEQSRIATAVWGVARSAVYRRGGSVAFELLPQSQPTVMLARIHDEGASQSPDFAAAPRLMDHCDIEPSPRGGYVITLRLMLPSGGGLEPARLSELAAMLESELRSLARVDPTQDLAVAHDELLTTLTALRERQDELARLSSELQDTNRGVVALYAELDDQAARLRQADEMKSRFLSNVSHEFRTPLSSIRALAKLLLSGVDGELAPEHAKQVGFIRKTAQDLSELVDDLLDLAKIEAGKSQPLPREFAVDELFSALRATLKPLLTSDSVALVFEPCPSVPPLYTDEAKLAQILRNLISNALKFTPQGEVRVRCELLLGADGASATLVRFSVRDTGIGIAREHLDWVFEEFTQVHGELQRHHKGTGLGLPLCKRLANLLGGGIHVESEPGHGSCFQVAIPLRCEAQATDPSRQTEPTGSTDATASHPPAAP